jgi:opacity protein-like surface antigen
MRESLWVGCAAVLILGGVAEARDDDTENKQGDFNVFLRGGVGNFTGELASVTQTGPTWGLTVNVQPWNILGYEITYDGSRNLVEDARLVNQPAVTRYGLAGMLKLGPPLIESVRPFVGLGLGATMVRVSQDAGGLYKNDLLEEVPVAAGIEFNTGAVTAGLRASYRYLVGESFADPSTIGNLEGGYLDAAVTLGARF